MRAKANSVPISCTTSTTIFICRYWIGRGVTAGTARTRWSSLLESPMYAHAQSWSARWGVLAVPMSFLTVGVQSFIQISAGVARMPLRRYVVATAAGAIVWAAVYTTIGMAIVTAWLTGPIGRVVIILAAAALTASIVVRRRRRRSDASGDASSDGPKGDDAGGQGDTGIKTSRERVRAAFSR